MAKVPRLVPWQYPVLWHTAGKCSSALPSLHVAGRLQFERLAHNVKLVVRAGVYMAHVEVAQHLAAGAGQLAACTDEYPMAAFSSPRDGYLSDR